MKSLAILLLLFVLQPTFAADCQRLHEFDEITGAVTAKFYDKSFRGLDWQSRLRFYRARVSCDEDEEALAEIVNALLSELDASHTALYTPNDLEFWALQSIFSRDMEAYKVNFLGIWPAFVNGRWHAKYVLPDSPAGKAGVLDGDALLGIDDADFAPLGLLERSEIALTVSSDGRIDRRIRIRPMEKSISRFFLDASESSIRIIMLEALSIGYFHLWSGTHPTFLQALNTALSHFEENLVDALVLDLRGGFGGASLDYVAKLRESEYLRSIPKFVLIDDGVRSGKELVAGTIKQEKLATLVGSRTAGAFLGGSPVRFENEKYFLYVAVGRFVPPGIGEIEKVGIQPDVFVPACRTYCAGRDPQFEKVLELLGVDG